MSKTALPTTDGWHPSMGSQEQEQEMTFQVTIQTFGDGGNLHRTRIAEGIAKALNRSFGDRWTLEHSNQRILFDPEARDGEKVHTEAVDQERQS